MAVSSKYIDNNMVLGNHLLFKGEALDMVVAHIPVANVDDWNQAKEFSLFYDEVGIGWKVAGQRKYFQDEAQVNALIQTALNAADARHHYDPTGGALPANPNGGTIAAGTTFVVTKDGTFDGIALNKGDILEAITDISGSPVGSDFLLNRASGLQNVPEATTAFHGIVKLIESVRLDGSANHDTVTTEKAVADLVIGVRDTLNATITAVQTQLQTNIDANTALINALDNRVGTLETEMDAVEAKNAEQDGRLTTIETKNVEQDGRLTATETKNTEQDGRLTAAEADIAGIIAKNTEQDGRLDTEEAKNVAQDTRLTTLETEMDAVEAKNVEQDGKIATLENEMDAVEAKNVEQDTRLTDVENEVDNLQTNDSTQDARLTALEEWTDQKVTIPLGDGVSEEFVAAIPNVEFKDVDIVGANLMAMQQNGTYRKNSAIFPFEVFVEGGVQKVRAKFAYAPAAGAYAIMLTGTGKLINPPS